MLLRELLLEVLRYSMDYSGNLVKKILLEAYRAFSGNEDMFRKKILKFETPQSNSGKLRRRNIYSAEKSSYCCGKASRASVVSSESFREIVHCKNLNKSFGIFENYEKSQNFSTIQEFCGKYKRFLWKEAISGNL